MFYGPQQNLEAHPVIYYWPFQGVGYSNFHCSSAFCLFFTFYSICLDNLVTICWWRAVLIAFRWCCFVLDAVVFAFVPFTFCVLRLMIITLSSTLCSAEVQLVDHRHCFVRVWANQTHHCPHRKMLISNFYLFEEYFPHIRSCSEKFKIQNLKMPNCSDTKWTGNLKDC